jgi:hypothetical protein
VSLDYQEEEDFKTKFNGNTLLRILSLPRPHLPWVIGFLLTIMAVSAWMQFLPI